MAQAVYVCICNALTDGDIHHATTMAGARRPLEVFEACRCRVQCGTCVRLLVTLLRQAATDAAGPTPPRGLMIP